MLKTVWLFYRDGFRRMTWGRVLWVIIFVKLFVMFALLKLFFFPDFLQDKGDKSHYVGNELIERSK